MPNNNYAQKQLPKEQILAKAMNQQYLIVQENINVALKSRGLRTAAEVAAASNWASLPTQNNNKIPNEKLINGDDSYYSKLQNETVQSLDQSVFLRHSDIDDVDFKIRLDFLRDFKNKLGLLNKHDEIVFREQLERDSTRQVIAKLATRAFQAGGEQKIKNKHL